MSKRKTTIALMYDFDKTLCTKDMQEYSFIPNIGMQPDAFWAEANALAKTNKMDRILAYLYLMIKKANASDTSIRREDFVNLGKDIEFFPGVAEWFIAVNDFAKQNGALIEHYIISSGLKEIIEGTEIAKYFKAIYACAFYYDQNGVAAWPQTAVNYTTKTQFLFRINKGVFDLSDDETLNKYVEHDKRHIPFRNMIYIGDGLTDVPCMKLVKEYGGKSIAVYQKRQKGKVDELLKYGRVDFVLPADYSRDGELFSIIKDILTKIIAEDKLITAHLKQREAL